MDYKVDTSFPEMSSTYNDYELILYDTLISSDEQFDEVTRLCTTQYERAAEVLQQECDLQLRLLS